MIDIVQLRALMAKAAPPPWKACKSDGTIYMTSRGHQLRSAEFCDGYDAELAAEAVNALPALLDELEKLREVEKAARSVHGSGDHEGRFTNEFSRGLYQGWRLAASQLTDALTAADAARRKG